MKIIVITASVRAVKARRVPRRATYGRPVRASSPARPGRDCGVNCCAIKHNGLLHKVRPVTALKLRLVATPLRCASRPCGFAQPPLCLAPLRPARVACCSLRVATNHTPDIHGVCGHGKPSPQAFWPGASRSITSARPAHPGPSVAPGFSRLRRLPARYSQTGPSQSQSPTACTALRAVLQLWHTNPIPLDWRGCSTVPSQ